MRSTNVHQEWTHQNWVVTHQRWCKVSAQPLCNISPWRDQNPPWRSELIAYNRQGGAPEVVDRPSTTPVFRLQALLDPTVMVRLGFKVRPLRDGGGKPSPGRSPPPLRKPAPSLVDLGKKILGLATSVVDKVIESIHRQDKHHPFPPDLLEQVRSLVPGSHRDTPFDGQPFFLDHLRSMAEMAHDPDSQYFEVLKTGVPLGVKEPPLKSPGIWPTKEELKGESPLDGALEDPRGRGNYASAEIHSDDIRKTFLEERDMDMVLGPLTAAGSKSGSASANSAPHHSPGLEGYQLLPFQLLGPLGWIETSIGQPPNSTNLAKFSEVMIAHPSKECKLGLVQPSSRRDPVPSLVSQEALSATWGQIAWCCWSALHLLVLGEHRLMVNGHRIIHLLLECRSGSIRPKGPWFWDQVEGGCHLLPTGLLRQVLLPGFFDAGLSLQDAGPRATQVAPLQALFVVLHVQLSEHLGSHSASPQALPSSVWLLPRSLPGPPVEVRWDHRVWPASTFWPSGVVAHCAWPGLPSGQDLGHWSQLGPSTWCGVIEELGRQKKPRGSMLGDGNWARFEMSTMAASFSSWVTPSASQW